MRAPSKGSSLTKSLKTYSKSKKSPPKKDKHSDRESTKKGEAGKKKVAAASHRKSSRDTASEETDEYSTDGERKGRCRRSTHAGVKRGRSFPVREEKKARDRARIVSAPGGSASGSEGTASTATSTAASAAKTVSAPSTRPNVLDRTTTPRTPLTWFLLGNPASLVAVADR
eukprot:GHVT01096132.1.p3 GENE.GHVT01096132.1~~GHVT01096132.1.p3  ORF type:complete len:171 (-),score=12.06 GHVT01096132.1:329-841(-)